MSDRPVIFATNLLPPKVTERLIGNYQARLNENDRKLSEDELQAGLMGADGVITSPTVKWDATRIQLLPDSVKVLTTFSVGFEHIDVQACRERNIAVGNTPDVLTEATADIALLCLLGAARRSWEAETMLREGRWSGWNTMQLVGMELKGRKLGIIGMGRIGRAVAARARGFGLEIHYHNRTRLDANLELGAVFHADFHTMLPEVDIISLNCPATDQTENMVNAAFLDAMKPGSILVNTARGSLVDERALMAALESGKLAAAGLDVFKNEPHVDEHLLVYDNLFALPHIGSATLDTRNAMGFCCLDNLDAYFAGNALPYPVG